MAKVKIQGNASGTGVFTITPPATSTDRTLTLPDSAGTILDSTSTLDATKLSGALPAISGASLTGITHTPADNSVTLAKMAHGTDGELITYDAAGAPANVAVGTSGHILTSGGAGVAPTFQAAAAGGGKVLQVVSTTYTDTGGTSTSSTSYVTTGHTVSITPSATSSKILIIMSGGGINSPTQTTNFTFYRDSTNLADSYGFSRFHSEGSGGDYYSLAMSYLDSPSTTSSVTYSVRYKVAGGTCYYNTNDRGDPTITVMEIGA